MDNIAYSRDAINELPLPLAERQAIYDGLERAWAEGKEEETHLILSVIVRLSSAVVSGMRATAGSVHVRLKNAITPDPEGDISA